MKHLINILIAIIFISSVNITSVEAVAPRAKLKPSDYSTNISWQKAQKSGKLLAVNFYVDWCGYCRKFAPVLESLRKKYDDKIIFVFINCEAPENTKLVRDFNIRSYPTFYLVNPKKDNRVFLDRSMYSEVELMSKEVDRFIKNN